VKPIINIKSYALLLSIILLSIILITPVWGIPNPAAVYCEELGYSYNIEKTLSGERGVCKISEGIELDGWDFFKGKVGKEYSYCAKHGYDIETEILNKDGYTVEHAVCVPKAGGARISLHELMENNGVSLIKTKSEKTGNKEGYIENRILAPSSNGKSDIESSNIRALDKELNDIVGIRNIRQPSNIKSSSRGDPLPSAFDWRNKDGHTYIGSIRDQGNCGSCYAFGALAAAEGTYNWATGKYDENAANFSEAFLAFCLSDYYSGFDGCGGANYEYEELDALIDEGMGICNESAFPYTDHEQPCHAPAWGAPRIEFENWYRIDSLDIDSIKTALMTYGVIDAAVYVTTDFQTYAGGIFNDSQTTCPFAYYTTTNHAIALVGWGYNESYGDYWILRNSWGDTWGENGYMRIAATSARVACAPAFLRFTNLTLNPYSISPSSPAYVKKDHLFNFSTGVACLNGYCGDVSATLTLPPSQPTTCSDIWGFDCGTGPPETGGDNTFDACSPGAGGDESIYEIYLDRTELDFEEEIETSCAVHIPSLNCGQGYVDDRLYVYYRNSSTQTWQKIHYVPQVYSCMEYWIRFNPDRVEGEHQVRCIVGWNISEGECGAGEYYDNDDANFSVYGHSSGQGMVPMNYGSPFYTINPNPMNCTNMTNQSTCNQIWTLNATGGLDTSWQLYTIYESDLLGIDKKESEEITVMIVEHIPPKIQGIGCYNGNSWVDCSTLGYGDRIEQVRANCTTMEGIAMYTSFKLANLPDNYTFFENNGSYNPLSGYWEYDNTNVLIEDSGDWEVLVTCGDSVGGEGNQVVNWFVPFGVLQSYLIDPTSNIIVGKGSFFNFSSGVRCVGGECGDVNAILDPKVELYYDDGTASTYWYDANFIWAVRFTAPFYPLNISKAKVMVYDPNSTGNYSATVHVYEDNYGVPGIDLIPPFNTTIDTFFPDWEEFGLNVPIVSGDFWIGITAPGNPAGPYALSDSGTIADRSMFNDGSNWNLLSNDLMIRAFVEDERITLFYDSFETGFGNWSNVAGDDIDWTRHTGSTTSSNTGPAEAHGGNYYVYTESSGFYGKVAILEGPTMDLDSYRDASIRFWYHMYGSTMGNLSLEISDGANWTELWSKIGDQGDAWYNATIDLSSYTGSRKLRFKMITGSSFSSDAALDDIRITSSKGTIPMNSGEPFYTINQNPALCADLRAGDVCETLWLVNATGETNTTHTFFTIYSPINYSGYIPENETSRIKITIMYNPPPVIHEIECQENNSIWQDCSDILYNDYLTAVRVNCTDPDGVKGASLRLFNVPDNYEFFNNNASFANGYWIYDNSDILIQDSGRFDLTASCVDNLSYIGHQTHSWTVPFGVLHSYLIDPISDIMVEKGSFFNFSAGVSCVGGECGDVNATLDPTIILQPYAGQDSWITSLHTNDNYGSSDEIRIMGSTLDNQRGLLYFNLSEIPPNSNITNANLTLYNYGAFTTSSQTISIFRVTNPWEQSEVTWNKRDSTTDWTTPGGDYNSTRESSLSLTFYNTWYTWNITSLVQKWADGIPNYGMILYGTGGEIGFRRFYSSDYGIGAYRPKLEVAYIPGEYKTTVPMNNGTPFYTIDQNPIICMDMQDGDSCNQTWRVNATGSINSSFVFFVIYQPTQYLINTTNTMKLNITIVSQLADMFNIDLYEGWNLISLPLQPADPAIGTVLSGLSGQIVVWYYNASADLWTLYDTDAPFPWLNTLHYMVHGDGYWLKSTMNQTLIIQGTTVPSYTMGLMPGWNFVGYNTSTTPMPDPISSLTTPIVVWTYYTDKDEWRLYDTEAPFPWLNTLTNMTAGKGYWMKSNVTQNWNI